MSRVSLSLCGEGQFLLKNDGSLWWNGDSVTQTFSGSNVQFQSYASVEKKHKAISVSSNVYGDNFAMHRDRLIVDRIFSGYTNKTNIRQHGRLFPNIQLTPLEITIDGFKIKREPSVNVEQNRICVNGTYIYKDENIKIEEDAIQDKEKYEFITPVCQSFDKVTISGNINLVIDCPIDVSSTIILSGNSVLSICGVNMDASELNFDLSGSSTVRLKNVNAKKVTILASGEASFIAEECEIEELHKQVSGKASVEQI